MQRKWTISLEDHETAVSTLSRQGFVLFTEKDLDDEDGLT